MKNLGPILVALGFFCAPVLVNAEPQAVSITDTLRSATSESLNGRTPNGVDTTGATWSDSQSTTTSLTGALPPDGNIGDNLIAIPTVEAGGIYTLTLTLTGTATNGGEAELGFTNDSNQAVFNNAGPNIIEDTVQARGYYGSPIATNPYGSLGNGGDRSLTPITYSIVLNTIGTPTSTDWTIADYANGVEFGTYTYTSNPTGLDFVEFANGGGVTQYTNFAYTAIAPEPATYAYLVAGIAFCIWLRRRTA